MAAKRQNPRRTGLPRIETILLGIIGVLVLCLIGLSLNAALRRPAPKAPEAAVEAPALPADEARPAIGIPAGMVGEARREAGRPVEAGQDTGTEALEKSHKDTTVKKVKTITVRPEEPAEPGAGR